MAYRIHFVGRRVEKDNAEKLLFSVCNAGDERFVALTTDVAATNCPSCKKHGIYLQALYNQTNGSLGKISKKFCREYNDAITLSEIENERLAYYGYWHWIKAMSMVRLWLDHKYDIDEIESSEELWSEVLECIQIGDTKRLKAIAPKWRKRAFDESDLTHTNTAIESVNEFRTVGFKFPEFGSARLIPTKNELFMHMSRQDEKVLSVEQALVIANNLFVQREQNVQETLRSEALSFEISCILAESVLMTHSKRVIEQILSDARFQFHPSTVEKLSVQAKSLMNSDLVLTIGGENSIEIKKNNALIDFLFSCKWIDPSVVLLSIDVAYEAKKRREACHAQADRLEDGSEIQRSIRQLASVYILPRGILIDDFGKISRVCYFELHGKLKNDKNFLFAQSLRLLES